MLSTKTDIVILGGGAAGLSLARELAHNSANTYTITVLEARTKYEDDRTWCFWASEHDFSKYLDSIVIKKWSRWCLAERKREITHFSDNFKYKCIKSKDFYYSSSNIIMNSKLVQLKMGTKVTEVHPNKNYVTIKTNRQTIQATYVIDTRPQTNTQLLKPLLYQIFSGCEIHSDQKIFTTDDTVGLMTDLISDANETTFIYTLPYSEYHGLVEYTTFSNSFRHPQNLNKNIDNYIKKRFRTIQHSISRREHGVLPMGFNTVTMNSHKRVFSAGIHGGAIRAATGYAFANIQKWSMDCAKAIVQSGCPIDQAPPAKIEKFMDTTFLKVVRNNQLKSATIFLQLASCLSANQFARFMSGRATLSDRYNVIKAMPNKWLFIKNMLN